MSELNDDEIKKIDNCTKHIVTKFVQTVVQSRQGERIMTHTKAMPTDEWFNLSIKEQPEVNKIIQQAFNGRTMDLSRPVCIEITLRTTEHEKMTLEYWYLKWTDVRSIPESGYEGKFMAVYNAIGILLKSVLIVSRSTPVYQLSRRQKNENFTICFDICFREPTNFSLDKEFQRQLIGTAPSPLGTVTAYVDYRTKLSVFAQHDMSDLTSTIKDDYFDKPQCKNRNVRQIHGFDVVDTDMLGTSPEHRLTSNPQEMLTCPKRAAFVPSPLDTCKELNDPDVDIDLPFAALLQYANAPLAAHGVKTTNCDSTNSHDSVKPETAGASVDSHCSETSVLTKDDFVMIELNAPFVGHEEDLGRFYRECQTAPALNMFEQTGNFQDMINSITDQLEQFEASAPEYNDFVNSLQDFE